MASGSIKDLFKSLNTFFSNAPPPSPVNSPDRTLAAVKLDSLTKDVHANIEAFVKKYTKIEEQDSQRLQEELIRIRTEYVSTSPDKQGPFVQTLRLLKPCIEGGTRIEEWWQLAIRPILMEVGPKRSAINQATAWVLDLLENGSGEATEEGRTESSVFMANALLNAYLSRTSTQPTDREKSASEDDHVAKRLESVLITYGRKKPKGFLLAIDRLFVRSQHRLQALSLMCSFVRYQPPHLYNVKQTPIIEHLIKCLMIDTSTTAISLALTILIMLLPHIPSSVRTHLPRLFLIYSRLLCWKQQTSATADLPVQTEFDKESPKDEREQGSLDEEQWEKLESSFDATESTPPELLHFFTFLYGLYPLNFTSYIYKPRKYMKRINFPRAEEFDLDQNLIRKKSEQFRRVHLLHPNFFTTTLEDEQQDDRWLKTDPPDVVSECMALCTATTAVLQDPTPPPTARLSELSRQNLADEEGNLRPQSPNKTQLRSNSMPGTPSTIGSPLSSMQDDDGDSLTIPSFPPLSRKDGSSQPSSIAPSPHVRPVSRTQMPRSPALRTAAPMEASVAHLQREVILLRSDLNFELYLKQQHLSHIGELQRRAIKEATVEAETLNLINTNRSLKAQLSKASELYASLKRETATGRNQSRRLESDLSTKVKTLKEEEKRWQAEEETLRVELSRVKTDCDHLRHLVVSSESKELLARQELQFAEIKLEQLSTLRKRITELEATIHTYQTRELEFAQAKDENDTLRQELETANLMIKSRDASAERATGIFERRIQEVESRVDSLQNPMVEGHPSQYSLQVQTLINSSVSGINAKYATLKKEHALLRHQYIELNMRYQELQDAIDSGKIAQHSSESRDSPYPAGEGSVQGETGQSDELVGS